MSGSLFAALRTIQFEIYNYNCLKIVKGGRLSKIYNHAIVNLASGFFGNLAS